MLSGWWATHRDTVGGGEEWHDCPRQQSPRGGKMNILKQYYYTICNSLTQQFTDISITIDTWATCFDSYRVIFKPSKNTDPIAKEVKCTVGSPMLPK
jgi:hypothetical protein